MRSFTNLGSIRATLFASFVLSFLAGCGAAIGNASTVLPHIVESDGNVGKDVVLVSVGSAKPNSTATSSCGGVWLYPHVLVTSADVAKGAFLLPTITDGERTYRAKGISTFGAVAVIHTEEEGFPALVQGKAVTLGEQLIVSGFTRNGNDLARTETSASVATESVRLSYAEEQFLVQGKGAAAFCGSAVYNTIGELVGITSRKTDTASADPKLSVLAVPTLAEAVRLEAGGK